MAQVVTGAASNALPPEGTFPFHILNIKHTKSQFGQEQLELGGTLTVPDDDGGTYKMNVKRWLKLPEGGSVPKNHAAAQLAGVVLFNTPTIEKGVKYDDEDERFVGANVLATVRHYEKGDRSANPGEVTWTFDGFAANIVTITPDEAQAIKDQFVLIFADGPKLENGKLDPVALKAAVDELMLEAIGTTKLTAELTVPEATNVRAAVKLTAKFKKVDLTATPESIPA